MLSIFRAPRRQRSCIGTVSSGVPVALHAERSTEELYAAPAVLDAALAALSRRAGRYARGRAQADGFHCRARLCMSPGRKRAKDVASALILEGCVRGICAIDGAEVFDSHSAAAALRVVREASPSHCGPGWMRPASTRRRCRAWDSSCNSIATP